MKNTSDASVQRSAKLKKAAGGNRKLPTDCVTIVVESLPLKLSQWITLCQSLGEEQHPRVTLFHVVQSVIRKKVSTHLWTLTLAHLVHNPPEMIELNSAASGLFSPTVRAEISALKPSTQSFSRRSCFMSIKASKRERFL